MGRSVSVPYNAQVVAYASVEDASDWESWDYDDYEADLVYRLQQFAPSMSEDSGWAGREDKILASNSRAFFGYSMYFDLVSIWLVPRDDSPLDASWVQQVQAKFEAEFAELSMMGRASNGEAFFKRIAA